MAKHKGSKKKAAKSKKAHARNLAEAGEPDIHMLDRLYATIESRRGADPSTSYTAKLMARGRDASDVALATTFGVNHLKRFVVHCEEVPET